MHGFSLSDRVVFSTLYSESDAFLPAYIGNFLAFTGVESVLVVNLPPGRALLPDRLVDVDRVFVFNGVTPRERNGHTLLVGHIESFDFAVTRIGAFGYFCPVASNSLFARRFDFVAAVAQLGVQSEEALIDLDALPDHWWWPFLAGNPRLVDFFKREWGLAGVSGNQIEGLFASRQDWSLLHDRLPEIRRLGDLCEPAFLFPAEEVLPSTLFNNFGSGRYTTICRLFWENPGGTVGIADLLEVAERSADHISLMKWFRRDPGARETMAVTQAWCTALLSALASAHRAGDAAYLMGQRWLLEAWSSALRRQERFAAMTSSWRADPVGALRRWTSLAPSIRALRQIHRLDFRLSGPAQDGDAAYVYMEDTGQDLRLELDLTEGSATRLMVTCSALGDLRENALQAYLYLRHDRQDPGWTIFRLRVLNADRPDIAATVQRIVLSRNGIYEAFDLDHVAEFDGYREYYFRCEILDSDADIYFGIPIFANTSFDGLLDVARHGA